MVGTQINKDMEQEYLLRLLEKMALDIENENNMRFFSIYEEPDNNTSDYFEIDLDLDDHEDFVSRRSSTRKTMISCYYQSTKTYRYLSFKRGKAFNAKHHSIQPKYEPH